MKIRTDFVTNSSSTSYCIMGVNISPSDIGAPGHGDEEDFDYEKLQAKCDELRQEFPTVAIYFDEEGYEGVLGIDSRDMKGTETLNTFRKRAHAIIRKAIPENTEMAEFISGEFSNY